MLICKNAHCTDLHQSPNQNIATCASRWKLFLQKFYKEMRDLTGFSIFIVIFEEKDSYFSITNLLHMLAFDMMYSV